MSATTRCCLGVTSFTLLSSTQQSLVRKFSRYPSVTCSKFSFAIFFGKRLLHNHYSIGACPLAQDSSLYASDAAISDGRCVGNGKILSLQWSRVSLVRYTRDEKSNAKKCILLIRGS